MTRVVQRFSEFVTVVAKKAGIPFGEAVIGLLKAKPEVAAAMLAGQDDPVLVLEGDVGLDDIRLATGLEAAEEPRMRHGPPLPLRTAGEPAFGGRPAPTESATDKAMRLAKEVVAVEGITLAEATARVFREHPDLYAAYREQTLVHVGPRVISAERPSALRQGVEKRATKKAMELAEKLAAEQNISISEATARIFREHRDLYEQYRAEVSIEI